MERLERNEAVRIRLFHSNLVWTGEFWVTGGRVERGSRSFFRGVL